AGLAGALGHFAGAAAYAQQHLSSPEREDSNRGRVGELCDRARELLAERDGADDGADAVATTIARLGDAADCGVAGARELLGGLLSTLQAIDEGQAAAEAAGEAAAEVTSDQVTEYLRRRFGDGAAANAVH